jgi:hypothetical protein
VLACVEQAMPDERLEVFKSFSEGRDKMVYFLLAASGAAIAFAITQTQTATITQSKIPLALAIVCWGASFFSGCRQIYQVNSILYQNYQILRIEERHRNSVLSDNDRARMDKARRQLEKLADRSGKWGTWQFTLLGLGAGFYISWHTYEMYLRTPH